MPAHIQPPLRGGSAKSYQSDSDGAGGVKLAVMQPYLFPYIGYFQLIYAADIFLIYDDVAYIKRGFVNRNNLLTPNEECLKWLTFFLSSGLLTGIGLIRKKHQK